MNKAKLGHSLYILCAGSVAAFFALAFAASLGALASRSDPDLMAYAVFILLVLCGAGWGGWRLLQKFPEDREIDLFVWGLLLVSLVLRICIVWKYDAYPQKSDYLFFAQFVDEMVQGRCSDDTMQVLSRYYDYSAWTHRAFLGPYWICRLAGGGADAVRWVQWTNTFLVTGIIGLTYLLGLHVCSSRKTAALAAGTLAFLPLPLWMALDYSHHIYGSLYFVLFIWILLKMWKSSAPWRWGIPAGILLTMLFLFGGLDRLGLALLLAVFIGMIGHVQGWRKRLLLLVSVVVLPVCLWGHVRVEFSRWVRANDRVQLNAGGVAFLARGWMLESGGEYNASIEKLDCATASPDDGAMMWRLMLSQFREHPVQMTIKLPLVKMAKFWLYGFASGEEECFQAGGYFRTALLYRAWRLASVPILLGMALIGLAGWVAGKPNWSRFLLVITGAGLCLGTCLLGETSPRYSSLVAFIPVILFGDGAGTLLSSNRMDLKKGLKHVGFGTVVFLPVFLLFVYWGWFCAARMIRAEDIAAGSAAAYSFRLRHDCGNFLHLPIRAEKCGADRVPVGQRNCSGT